MLENNFDIKPFEQENINKVAVSIEPKTLTVAENNYISLTCEIKSKILLKNQLNLWSFPHKKSSENYLNILEIPMVQPNMSGVYKCSVYGFDGVEYFATAQVKIIPAKTTLYTQSSTKQNKIIEKANQVTTTIIRSTTETLGEDNEEFENKPDLIENNQIIRRKAGDKLDLNCVGGSNTEFFKLIDKDWKRQTDRVITYNNNHILK
jgi:hypothetical protein